MEDKKEEGNFDLSISVEEMGDSENLQSAAADLEAADAMVKQVEDNLFAKAEEEEQAEKEAADLLANTSSKVLEAEQEVASSDEAVFAVSDALRESLEGDAQPEEMTEEQLAEATIARMIAEQEALLKQDGKGTGSFDSKPAAPQETATLNEDSSDAAETESIVESPSEDDALLASAGFGSYKNENDVIDSDAPSVFGNSSEPEAAPATESDDEDALAAALEEEMMAQLEAEQEALLEEQTSQIDEQSSGEGNTSLSDLAKKFD